MGYELHITRAEHWSESADTPVTLEEWLDYLSRDAEMRLDGYAETITPAGETIRIERPGLAVWTGYQGTAEGDLAWFDWDDGEVVVKNPDEQIIAKMRAIASALGAEVQGDDGETY